jgi:NAD(P)-dependent dehydrogenase (short-subunit alcohol dehydrogenase family)
MTSERDSIKTNGLTRRDLLTAAAAGVAAQTFAIPTARAATRPGTVLITGSNRGIGLELARWYAEHDWRVIATARKPDRATDLQAIADAHPKVQLEQLDLLDHRMIDGLATTLADQPIDVLLNNAAILGEPNEQNFGSMNFDLLSRVMATNVAGPMKMAEAFVAQVEASEQKKIVAITSTQGSISSLRSPGLVFYNMSKTALNMGMKSNSKALKKRGITVALISPGAVDTDMMNLALERAGVRFKLLTPVQSAEAVTTVIDGYGLEQTGTFLSHKGESIPW